MIYFALNLAKPSLRVEILSTHSPTQNIVKLDGKRLYPEGEGGVVYKIKTSAGSHTISIKGPFVEAFSESLNLGISEAKNITIDPKELSAEEVLRNALQNKDVKLSDIHVEYNAIAGVVIGGEPNQNGDTTYPVIFGYDSKTEEWQKIQSSQLSTDFPVSKKTQELFDENSAE